MKKTHKKVKSVKPVPKKPVSIWQQEIDSVTGTVILLACFTAAFITVRYLTTLTDMLIRSQVFYY